MTEQGIYEKFIDWLGSGWWHMPESEFRLPMIRAHYTPEEAAFLTGFPHRPSTLEEIADMKGLEPEELASKLKELSRKGMVYATTRGESTRYRLSDPMLAMMRANLWPQQPDDEEWLRKSSPLINRYYLDNWADQWEEAHVKGLRAIPIDRTIKDTRAILPYEDEEDRPGRCSIDNLASSPMHSKAWLIPQAGGD